VVLQFSLLLDGVQIVDTSSFILERSVFWTRFNSRHIVRPSSATTAVQKKEATLTLAKHMAKKAGGPNKMAKRAAAMAKKAKK